MVVPDEPTVYHVLSRSALDGFPFGDVEKDYLLKGLVRKVRLAGAVSQLTYVFTQFCLPRSSVVFHLSAAW
jgi:hypothetical protein